MIPYIICSVVIFLLAHLRFFHGYGRAMDSSISWLVILSAAVLSSTGQLGTDYEGYLENFDSLDSVTSQWWEPGFQLLALSARTVGLPYDPFIGLCTLATLIVAYVGARQLTYNRALFIFCLFCFQLLATAFTRQQLAASLVFLGFSFAVQNRFWMFVTASILATSIHSSAALFSIFIFLVCFRKQLVAPRMLVFIILSTVATLLALSNYMLSERFAEQASVYLNDEFSQGADEDSAFLRNTLKYVLYMAFAVGFKNAGSFHDRTDSDISTLEADGFWLIIIFSIFSLLLCVFVSPVFSRLSVYIFPLIAIMLGNVFALKNRYSIFLYSSAAIFLPAYLYVSLYPIREFY